MMDFESIIDVHGHVFPHQNTRVGYPTRDAYKEIQVGKINEGMWRQFVTNKTDPKYIPTVDEIGDINFRVGDDGRFYWEKHGEQVWLQRFPASMKSPEWTTENLIACMDAIGVDQAVLQAEYLEKHRCIEYFSEAINEHPDRLIGSFALDYDSEADEASRAAELELLEEAAATPGMEAVFQAYPKQQDPNNSEFDPLWEALVANDLAHYFHTGFLPKPDYLETIDQITNLLARYPGLDSVVTVLGGNIKPSDHPDYTDTPREWFSYFEQPNAYMELGYVLAFEDWDQWGRDYEYPFPVHTRIVRDIHDNFGVDNLVWGSDIPFIFRNCTYRQCLDLVRLHFDFMTDDEKAAILGDNPRAIFSA